jgi:hypothetical protein
MYGYVIPWFAPTISFGDPERPERKREPKEIELIGTPIGGAQTERDVHPAKEDSPESTEPESTEPESTGIVSYIPHVSVHMPSSSEIATRAVTTLIIDLPIFTVKQLYSSPIPTIIALYAMLPTEVWKVLGPRLLRMLPRLLL